MIDAEKKRFAKDFTLQEPICDAGIEKAVAILKSGKIHRYNVDPDEKGEAALLEEEFAAYMGKKILPGMRLLRECHVPGP